MKFCFTLLAMIGLAVGMVGCGPANTPTSGSSVNTTPDLGSPGDIEAGPTTAGMDSTNSTDDAANDDTAPDNSASGGPELR